MAKINWNRHNYTSRLDADYWNNPKKGFDKQWHESMAIKKAKAEEAKLQMQREKIKALRKNKTQG